MASRDPVMFPGPVIVGEGERVFGTRLRCPRLHQCMTNGRDDQSRHPHVFWEDDVTVFACQGIDAFNLPVGRVRMAIGNIMIA